MVKPIQQAAVIGSGVMGAGIAAHLANAGLNVVLLDIVPEGVEDRNILAQKALKQLVKQKPAPLASPSFANRIQVGNIEDAAHLLAQADWIIEVVTEQLDVKKRVLEWVDQHRRAGSIVSSNTSGISIHDMKEGRSGDFRAHFLGTHFFNPPRYLKLLEVIPSDETNKDVVAYMTAFGEDRLGKGVVIAKDTPNFIGNRIGTFGLLNTLRVMDDMNLKPGEVDSITGTLIGRPKSATFRTLDVVGIDTFIHVAKNVSEKTADREQRAFAVPDLLLKMVENGWIGAKAGQGFYKKNGKNIEELDPSSLTYGPRTKMKANSIEIAKGQKGAARWQALLFGQDEAAQFLWKTIAPVLVYSAEKTGEIADSIVAIDNAMKWGFGWKEGPFELWDQLGRERAAAKMKEDGMTVPDWVLHMSGPFYQNGQYYDHQTGGYKPVERHPKQIQLGVDTTVVHENSGARLHDMGDGVALLEFTSPNNAIGLDIIQMINKAVDETEKKYRSLIIGNQGKNFCVGANLAMILMAAQDDDLWEIDMTIKQFQQAMMRIKYCQKPVVAAPFQMTLGGGTEVCLPAAHIQAAHETYMGLVETGVGLIPGGGGNKESYSRYLNQMADNVPFDLQAVANKVFETVALAKVSTSAQEAKELHFLSPADGISMNGDHLLSDAKAAALHLAESYVPPMRRPIPVVGETGYATMLTGAKAMHQSGYLSDHDLVIAKKLAWVIAGGNVPFGTEVDEEYLLDIERKAFMELASMPKTQQRMQHMLLNGKPLRN